MPSVVSFREFMLPGLWDANRLLILEDESLCIMALASDV